MMQPDDQSEQLQTVLDDEYAAPQLDAQFSADLICRLQAELHAKQSSTPKPTSLRTRRSVIAVCVGIATVAALIVAVIWIAKPPVHSPDQELVFQSKTNETESSNVESDDVEKVSKYSVIDESIIKENVRPFTFPSESESKFSESRDSSDAFSADEGNTQLSVAQPLKRTDDFASLSKHEKIALMESELHIDETILKKYEPESEEPAIVLAESQFDPQKSGLSLARESRLQSLDVFSEFAGGSGIEGGTWPKSWPKELEPLREQASTWVGGELMYTAHEISFTKQETFEAAWPHILSLKSDGASLTLMNVKQYYRGSEKMGGVIILPPIDGYKTGELSLTRIVLLVDGDVVDLNRIRLPNDTPIIDERFRNEQKK